MLVRLTQVVVDQVGLPPAQQPEKGGLWDSIMGPFLPLVGQAWWLVIHLAMPICFIGGTIGLIIASIAGNRRGAERFRGVIFAVPLALLFVGFATIVSNFVISHWPTSS